MLNKRDNFYSCNITVITNNNELINDVNKFGKKIELEHIKDKEFYDDLLITDYYPIVNANSPENAKVIIVANDIDNYIPDGNKYNIQFHNGNRIDGFDAYIHCDNYKDAIMDIIRLAYGAGLVSIDLDDVVKFTYGKTLHYYRYTIDSSISTNEISELVNINKDCISILYGSKNLSLKEVEQTIDSFKNKNIEFYIGVQIDNNIPYDKRVLSLFLQE